MRGVRHATQLLPELKKRGIQFSAQQIANIVKPNIKTVRLDVVRALCEFLDCSPSDLIQSPNQRRLVVVPKTKRKRTNRTPKLQDYGPLGRLGTLRPFGRPEPT